MAKTNQGSSCSVCKQTLVRGEEYITLDGGQHWCPTCWSNRFYTAATSPASGQKDIGLVLNATDHAIIESMKGELHLKPDNDSCRKVVISGATLPLLDAGIPAKPKTSGLAVASLIAAIVGVCAGYLGGPAAIVLGLLAVSSIGKKPGTKGRGLAIAAIATGIVDIVGWTVILIILYRMGALVTMMK